MFHFLFNKWSILKIIYGKREDSLNKPELKQEVNMNPSRKQSWDRPAVCYSINELFFLQSGVEARFVFCSFHSLENPHECSHNKMFPLVPEDGMNAVYVLGLWSDLFVSIKTL